MSRWVVRNAAGRYWDLGGRGHVDAWVPRERTWVFGTLQSARWAAERTGAEVYRVEGDAEVLEPAEAPPIEPAPDLAVQAPDLEAAEAPTVAAPAPTVAPADVRAVDRALALARRIGRQRGMTVRASDALVAALVDACRVGIRRGLGVRP